MKVDDDGTVVVAVGNDTTGQARDWAAAEASARRCRLHVGHAGMDPIGTEPVHRPRTPWE